MERKLRGVFAVTVTPFDEHGMLDEAALRRHLRWMLDEGSVSGVIPTGSTGEFAFLTGKERRRVAEVVMEEVNGQVPVWIGAAACSTEKTVRNARFARDLGAAGVMVIAPFFGHLSQEELYLHFRSLAESVDLPIMLYNNPGAAGSDILPETVARLSELANVVAIKESSGIMQRVGEIQRLCGDRIQVLCGCDTLPLEMFLMGVEGWVAAPANLVPRQCVELYRLAVEQPDLPAARALYDRLLPLFAMFEGTGQYVQLNKTGLAMLGRPVGRPRPPLQSSGPEQQAQLKVILDSIYGQSI